MQYFVIGADGKEYGPADVSTLQGWARENRLSPQTMLKDFQTGQSVPAGSIAGIFPAATVPPPANWSQPPAASPYPRGVESRAYSDEGNADVLWAIGRAVAAVVFFFALHGIGLIFAIYGVVSASRAKSKGHRHGNLALGISIAALVAVGIGWLMRMSGSPALR